MARIKERRSYKLGPETVEQIKLFDWINHHKNIAPFAMHIANERKTSYQRGNMLKRMGVRSGVSDVFIAIPTASYHGLWIELKSGKGKPTDNQLIFMENMDSQGYSTHICYSADEAIEVIEAYLRGSGGNCTP